MAGFLEPVQELIGSVDIGVKKYQQKMQEQAVKAHHVEPVCQQKRCAFRDGALQKKSRAFQGGAFQKKSFAFRGGALQQGSDGIAAGKENAQGQMSRVMAAADPAIQDPSV